MIQYSKKHAIDTQNTIYKYVIHKIYINTVDMDIKRVDRTLMEVLETGGHVTCMDGEGLYEYRSRCIEKAIKLIQDMVIVLYII